VTFATVQDVADELGRPITSSTEIAQINGWLRRVEATIKTRVPDLAALVTAGTLDAVLVAGVEAAIVARKALNPEGKSSETIDDYTYKYDSSAAAKSLTPTEDEWILLRPRLARGSFTIRPGYSS
jgi:hypothetical protein